MNRRNFLLSASMFVVALKLLPSTPALAAEPSIDFSAIPYDELVRIENVFRILEDYKFGLYAQASIFGINPWYIHNSHEDLRNVVHALAIDSQWPDTWQRIEYIEVIRRKLDAILGPEEISEHLFWLGHAPASWGFSFTFRDSIESGTLAELRFAAYNMTGERCRTNNPMDV